MNQFHLHNRRATLVIVFMTVIALLFVQTQMLHAHGPHDHHIHTDQLNAHQHHPEIHLATLDLNDNGHDSASEIDLSTKATVKNFKFTPPLLAALIFVVVLLLPRLISNRRWQILRAIPFNNHRSLLRPPLRAPPF